jgi:hypothetical protein
MLEPFTRRGLLRRRHPDRALSVFRRSLRFSASPRLPAHIPEGQNIMIDWVPQSRLVSEHKNAAQTARNDSVLHRGFLYGFRNAFVGRCGVHLDQSQHVVEPCPAVERPSQLLRAEDSSPTSYYGRFDRAGNFASFAAMTTRRAPRRCLECWWRSADVCCRPRSLRRSQGTMALRDKIKPSISCDGPLRHSGNQ